jgi:cytidylate kinase
MAVWTIAAQTGSGGTEIAAELARRAGVALLDREALLALAHELRPEVREDDDLAARLGGRLTALSLGAAVSTGSTEAFRELRLRRDLPELGRAVLREAASRPAVILAPAAFAALQDHPSAVHVRLRAPLACRVPAYRREELVDERCAEKALRREDARTRAWVRRLYHVDVDDPALFSLVIDVSRFPRDRVVETLLAAAAAHLPA